MVGRTWLQRRPSHEEVAPSAAEALFDLVGPSGGLKFYGLPDNLIINFPDDPEKWWAPEDKRAAGAHWHKDGDWFRHFLDRPEQGMLGIIFWRDVTERQGPTYLLSDSIPAVTRLLLQPILKASLLPFRWTMSLTNHTDRCH
ncbi:MAG: hypothetical protein ACLPYY_18130 [Acidimicrobiales bacterium]